MPYFKHPSADKSIPQKTEMVSPWLPMHVYLAFLVFHRYCSVYKLRVCGNCQASLLAPHFQWHLLTSCHILVFLAIFQTFSAYYICYGDLLISDHWCCYFNCFRKQFTTNQVALTVKYPPANAGDPRDMGLVFGLGRTPGAGNWNPLQYSCLENPLDRGDWWAIVHGVTKSWT